MKISLTLYCENTQRVCQEIQFYFLVHLCPIYWYGRRGFLKSPYEGDKVYVNQV